METVNLELIFRGELQIKNNYCEEFPKDQADQDKNYYLRWQFGRWEHGVCSEEDWWTNLEYLYGSIYNWISKLYWYQ